MEDEKERFLLSMKDKLGEHDYDRLVYIITKDAMDYYSALDELYHDERNGELC